jgi:hypothetical protein
LGAAQHHADKSSTRDLIDCENWKEMRLWNDAVTNKGQIYIRRGMKNIRMRLN